MVCAKNDFEREKNVKVLRKLTLRDEKKTKTKMYVQKTVFLGGNNIGVNKPDDQTRTKTGPAPNEGYATKKNKLEKNKKAQTISQR